MKSFNLCSIDYDNNRQKTEFIENVDKFDLFEFIGKMDRNQIISNFKKYRVLTVKCNENDKIKIQFDFAHDVTYLFAQNYFTFHFGCDVDAFNTCLYRYDNKLWNVNAGLFLKIEELIEKNGKDVFKIRHDAIQYMIDLYNQYTIYYGQNC